ncbi:hypothetical protein EG328_006574 [Venturia inaequalis]|uniref:Phosphatidic acid phosphatase type 2/haloperoxidase domain-containing protein n=1 Tax=Venturia inaequalis TaxID=5025 RepID=A0A8H3VTT9_VENIN|nr:hypothetical protein EG328_006574 [Venturia inaequalis]KAE9992719.1 hypothetical protein EG327_007941 [Venturia inaequalis]
MGLFSRQARPVDADTTTATGTPRAPTTAREKTPRGGGGLLAKFGGRTHGSYPETRNSRPTFGQWLKQTWVDIFTMAILGAIGLGVYMAPPAPSRSFPVTFQNGQVVYPQFAYPLRNEIIPIWASALMSVLIPIAIFLICAIRVRSFWDLNNAIMGLLYSVISAAVFQVFVKCLIGGFRPHFLAVCQPAVPVGGDGAPRAANGDGYLDLFYRPSDCTGDRKKINDALESMPSGHTTAAFAGFVFLSLYLNGKLKVFSNYHPSLWKLIAIYAPILGATLIGGALTIDKYHNWYDVVAGGIIGTIFAFSAYRMMYASVWDFRFNHIPLTRDIPFTYGAGGYQGPHHSFHDAVFTRQAGWGTADGMAAMGGAPFDSSALGGAQGLRSSSGNDDVGNGHRNGGGLFHSGSPTNHRGSLGRKPVGTADNVV